MNQRVSDPLALPRLAVGYYASQHFGDAPPEISDSVLAEIRFGGSPQFSSRGLHINVELDALGAPAPVEVWHAQGPVRCDSDGSVRFAEDAHHVFAVVEADERMHGGILGATEFAYAQVRRFQRNSPYPHVLRMWNYLDEANEGDGDMERYRQFCVGRTRGLGDGLSESYPAASAVGRQRTTHVLQVYWLAGRIAGVAVENPRQVSAYRYPHIYGPVSPSFSRATLAPDDTLMISGTASIVGHASHHIGDVTAQLDETLRNLETLIEQAGRQRPGIGHCLSDDTHLKVYVRDAAQLAVIEKHLRSRLPGIQATYLAADICRRELLLEIECAQRG